MSQGAQPRYNDISVLILLHQRLSRQQQQPHQRLNMHTRPQGAPNFRLLLLHLFSKFLLRSISSSRSELLEGWSVATSGSQLVSIRSSRRCPAPKAGAAPATAPKTRPATPHGVRSTATTADWTPDTLVRPCARTGPMACVVHLVPPVWHRVHLVPPVEQKVQVRIHTAYMQ